MVGGIILAFELCVFFMNCTAKPTLDERWKGRTRAEYENVFLNILPMFDEVKSVNCLSMFKSMHAV